MRKILTVVLAGVLIITLGSAPLAIAQESRSEGVRSKDNLGTLAFFPLPKPWSARYVFAGAADNSFAGANTSATVVMCTNLGKKGTDAIVEFYSWDGFLIGFTARMTILPHNTITFSSSPTGVFFDDTVGSLTADMEQGAARVVINNKKAKKSVTCNAMVVDRINDPPTFAVALTPAPVK